MSFSYGVVFLFFLQLGHNLLANFCEIIPFRASANKYFSTSISINLSIVDRESLVWRVDNTKCPVILALIAMVAVSESRISPIIIILGSCLKIERRALANVNPISEFTWI